MHGILTTWIRDILRYIVEHALGPVLRERLEALRARHHAAASGTARKALEEPAACDLDALNAPQRDALIAFYIAWQEDLARETILDPACGTAGFLISSYKYILRANTNAKGHSKIGRAHV